jgi:DNA-binding SARP family transcriptional activator
VPNESPSTDVLANATPKIELRLLDGFRVRTGGRDFDIPLHSQRLLAYLALTGRPTRETVSGTLWPDSPPELAGGSLRSTLWRVNKALPGVVRSDHLMLCLDDAVYVDVRWLQLWIRSALAGTAESLELLPSDLAGDLLPGWYDDWLLLQREHLRLLRLHAIEALAGRLRQRRLFGVALHAAYSVIRDEPLRESAHRLAIQIYLDEGNLADASRHARNYTELLHAELGIAPSPEFTKLLGSTTPR